MAAPGICTADFFAGGRVPQQRIRCRVRIDGGCVQKLKEAGFAEDQNVIIEYRWADDQYERLPALAADLVNLRVNVIFANSPSIPATLAATQTIPIIFNSG